MMPVRGILLVLAVWLVHTVHATGDAVCPSDGTLIAFGGAPDTNAAIGMDAGGDYAIFPEGVTVGREFWMDAQNSAAPHFARDVVIGADLPNSTCIGHLHSDGRGDLVAWLNSDGTGEKLYSLTEKRPLTDDVLTPGPDDTYYTLSSCETGSAGRNGNNPCDTLYIKSALDDNRRRRNFRDGNSGAGGFINPVTGTRTVYFGARRQFTNDGNPAGVDRETVVIMRSVDPTDKDMSGDFHHFDIDGLGPIGVAADPFDGEEVFVSTFRDVLYMHYSCNEASNVCDRIALTDNTTTVMGPPFMLTDEHSQLHIFYVADIAGVVGLQYKFCAEFDSNGIVSACVDRTLERNVLPRYSQQLNSDTYPLLSGGIHKNSDIVVVLAEEARLVTLPGGATQFTIVRLQNPGIKTPWEASTRVIPQRNDFLRIPAEISYMDVAVTNSDTPDHGIVIAFNSRHQRQTQGDYYIEYDTDGNTVNPYARQEPSSDYQQMEQWSVQAVLCRELSCTDYDVRQLFGSRQTYDHTLAERDSGVRVHLSKDVNNGYPIIGFSAAGGGAAPETFSVTNVPLGLYRYYYVGPDTTTDIPFPQSTTAPFYSGPINLIVCNDALCNSATFVTSSMSVGAHEGDFVLLPESGDDDNPGSILLGSIANFATNRGPNFQLFHNNRASPANIRCDADAAGLIQSADEEVYICSKLDTRPVLLSTDLYRWTPLAKPLRTQGTGTIDKTEIITSLAIFQNFQALLEDYLGGGGLGPAL